MRVCASICVPFTVLVRSVSESSPSLPRFFPPPPLTFRHGIALLLTYKCGSLRMPESQLYRVPLRWLGVRPSQILQRFDLPDEVFQDFSEGDARKCRSLLASPFCQAHPRWREEVEAMVCFSHVCICAVWLSRFAAVLMFVLCPPLAFSLSPSPGPAHTQADEHMKCELEALNTFSGTEGRRDFLCQFVVSSLMSGDHLS